MATLARPGTFYVGRYIELAAAIKEGANVRAPIGLVEIDGQEPAEAVLQYRINANRLLTSQMVVYYLIGNWKELTILTQAAFHLWLSAQNFMPFVAASGRVTRLALAIFSANWVDVFTATK